MKMKSKPSLLKSMEIPLLNLMKLLLLTSVIFKPVAVMLHLATLWVSGLSKMMMELISLLLMSPWLKETMGLNSLSLVLLSVTPLVEAQPSTLKQLTEQLPPQMETIRPPVEP